MATTLDDLVDQALDVRGSFTDVDTLTPADEPNELGSALAGQSGAAASMAAAAGGEIVVTGLTGMTAESVGNFLEISGAATGANNDTFLIVAFTSATQVTIVDNGTAPGADANNGALNWVERNPYSLQDDMNYRRTQERLIKGTANYYDAIPTYQRPTAIGTNVDKNLTNLVSLDSKAKICNRKFENAAVAATNTRITITDTGNLPHADAVDRTGVPIEDGADAGDLTACYVEIIEGTVGSALTVDGRATGSITTVAGASLVVGADTDTFVLNDGTNPAVTFVYDDDASVVESPTNRAINHTGTETADQIRDLTITAINNAPTLDINATNGGAATVTLVNTTGGVAGNQTITETVAAAGFAVTGMSGGLATAGNRIFGITEAGASTEPNSVEVVFYSVPIGDPLATTNPYTWESGQPTTIDLFYPFRERMDLMDENCDRVVLTSGIIGDAGQAQGLSNLRQVIDDALLSTDTHIGGLLTNKGDFYPFSDLPDATPSVVEALNTLNEQIGDRDYTGAVLTDGQTITESLQALANALGTASFTRLIERLAADIPAGTAHTLPGGNTYTIDATNNGQNMTLYWRGLIRSPGPVSGGNDYDETSTTTFTPYRRIRSSDHIHYFIYS